MVYMGGNFGDWAFYAQPKLQICFKNEGNKCLQQQRCSVNCTEIFKFANWGSDWIQVDSRLRVEKCIQSYSRSNPLWRCIPTNRGRHTFIPRVYSFVRLVVNLTGPFLHPLRNSWKQPVRDQYSLHTGKSKSALNVSSNNKLIKPIALAMWNYTVGNGK